jgi:hypothetical protein
MERRVDLTENGDFRDRNAKNAITTFIPNSWSQPTTGTSFSFGTTVSSTYIYNGTVSQRSPTQREIEDGRRCDCCGTSMDRIAWKKRENSTLCPLCYAQLDYTYKPRIPWSAPRMGSSRRIPWR